MMRWRCPSCGSDHLWVAIETWAELHQHDNGQYGTDPAEEDNSFDSIRFRDYHARWLSWPCDDEELTELIECSEAERHDDLTSQPITIDLLQEIAAEKE